MRFFLLPFIYLSNLWIHRHKCLVESEIFRLRAQMRNQTRYILEEIRILRILSQLLTVQRRIWERRWDRLGICREGLPSGRNRRSVKEEPRQWKPSEGKWITARAESCSRSVGVQQRQGAHGRKWVGRVRLRRWGWSKGNDNVANRTADDMNKMVFPCGRTGLLTQKRDMTWERPHPQKLGTNGIGSWAAPCAVCRRHRLS